LIKKYKCFSSIHHNFIDVGEILMNKLWIIIKRSSVSIKFVHTNWFNTFDQFSCWHFLNIRFFFSRSICLAFLLGRSCKDFRKVSKSRCYINKIVMDRRKTLVYFRLHNTFPYKIDIFLVGFVIIFHIWYWLSTLC